MRVPLFFSRLAALAIVQACMALACCAAITNAVVPYQMLDEMFQPIGKIDRTKLDIRVYISSRNKAVNPADITLTIQSAGKGLIPVPVGTNGEITKFPHEKDLSRENPSIVANQPKGTLNLNITMQLPPPDELTFRYSRLGDGVAEINKALKAQAGMVMGLFAPKVESVYFLFPRASAGKTTVEVLSAAGTKEYTADRKGQVKLKLEKKLLAENPEVKVSEKPEHIVPDMSEIK